MAGNQKENYITLKEASKLSGYAPDYIGQLIRMGKLPGKQIYFNVAWMTTERALRQYMEKNKNGNGNLSLKEKISAVFQQIKARTLLEIKLARVPTSSPLPRALVGNL